MADPKCLSSKMLLLLNLIAFVVVKVTAVRISQKIYHDLEGDLACFKRFNGTHEVGCTSDFNGNVGVLYIPSNMTDAKWAMDEGPHHPYMLALTPTLFTREILMHAKASGKVSGVIIMDGEETELPPQFSPIDSCPSHEYGLYNISSGSKYSTYCQNEAWNAPGSSLLFESFNFPMFLMQEQSSINGIKECFSTHKEWPLCALQLHANMFGATNSEVCWRRAKLAVLNPINYCDPIYDYNIFGSLKPMTGNLTDSSVTIIAARADAATMFNEISPGAESAVSGLVTLLAVAKALSVYKDNLESSGKNVMFILFEAEVWDRLGSFAVTYDMMKGEFPWAPDYDNSDHISVLNFSHVEHFIELSQLALQDTETHLHMFNDPISDSEDFIHSKNVKLRDTLTSVSESYGVISEPVIDDSSNAPYPLPPSSFQSFLKYENISGVVLGDHAKQFKNLYYQSYLDNSRYLGYNYTNGSSNSALVDHLQKIATVVANTVLRITGDLNVAATADAEFIDELLHCYLQNRNCTLFREHAGALINDKSYFVPRPAKMYASVGRGGEVILTNITQNILIDILGDKIPEAEENCTSAYSNAVRKVFVSTLGENGTCFNSSVYMKMTKNPAFFLDDYDFQSGEYPTWSESGWASMSARLFLKPNPTEEILLIIGGILIIAVSLMLSCFCFAKADVLFERSPAPTQC